MADRNAGNQLRDMAQHRGFKLVKSRRRKPGTGDNGKFGLIDATGKALLGISEAGLTASAQDIENYLRGGVESSWTKSAKITPYRPAQNQIGTNAKAGVEPICESRPRGGKRLERRIVNSNGRGARKSARAPLQAHEPEVQTIKPAAAVPDLVVRAPKPGEAKDLQRFLEGVQQDSGGLAEHLALVLKMGGVVIARLEGIVGCACWASIPSPQHGLVGRITWLCVAGPHRRRGDGTKLVQAAIDALAKKECALIEVMSDIDIKNSNRFLRSLGFEQNSYRFARAIER
jgi:ribosomal protein S18 acetylase RimI-like enzyme